MSSINESTGKTTLVFQMLSYILKNNTSLLAYYINAESSVNIDYFKKTAETMNMNG